MATVTNTTWEVRLDVVDDETTVSTEQGAMHLNNDNLKIHTSSGIKKVYVSNAQSVVSSATVTPTFLNDIVTITAQAEALTLANPTGTAVPNAPLIIRIKDNGTSRAITFDTQYRAIGVTLPTATTISKTLYLGLIYNSTDTKWDVIGVNLQS